MGKNGFRLGIRYLHLLWAPWPYRLGFGTLQFVRPTHLPIHWSSLKLIFLQLISKLNSWFKIFDRAVSKFFIVSTNFLCFEYFSIFFLFLILLQLARFYFDLWSEVLRNRTFFSQKPDFDFLILTLNNFCIEQLIAWAIVMVNNLHRLVIRGLSGPKIIG